MNKKWFYKKMRGSRHAEDDEPMPWWALVLLIVIVLGLVWIANGGV